MKPKSLIIFFALFIGFSFFISCQFDNGGEQEEQKYATVTFKLNQSQTQSSGDSQTSVPMAFSTAVTSVVHAVYPSVVAGDTNFADKIIASALADIPTKTVTLTLPYDTEMKLFKGDYSSVYTLEQIMNDGPYWDDAGLSDPFTITSGTTALSVTIDMESVVIPNPWNGTVLFGNTTTDHSHGLAIGPSDTLHTVGHSDASLGGQTLADGTDFYVAKFESDGDSSWVRMIGTPTGSSLSDNGTDVAVDSNGNVYATGHTSSTTTFGGVSVNGYGKQQFLVKYSSTGSGSKDAPPDRVVLVDEGSAVNHDEYKKIFIDASNKIYIVDIVNGLRVYDTNLSLLNSNVSFFPPKDSNDKPSSIAVNNSNGNIYIGMFDWSVGYARLLAFDSSLNSLSADVTGDVTYNYKVGVVVDSSGNVFFVGETSNRSLDGASCEGDDATGDSEVYIKKFNSSLVRQWTKLLCSNGYDYAIAVAVDNSGNAFVTGGTAGAFTGYTNLGSLDIFVAKYTSSGSLQWVSQTGTEHYEMGEDIVIDSKGDVIVTGSSEGNLDGKTNSATGTSEDIFLVKYSALTGKLQSGP
ncbi:SBBP repeat-containing protein [bacterium]|nr:SBBP repeat-containing protein [bacterium]